MMESLTSYPYRTNLHSTLKNVKQSGSYCVTGTLKSFSLPGLEVFALGPISLPLLPYQAQQLVQICAPAPFGRRDSTIYDDSVRKCRQLSPHEFRLAGLDWDSQVRRLADERIKRELGLPETLKVIPSLYKCLLYEAGGVFTSHRDTEKEEGMFGTLVIALPSAHSGGELVVRHAGQEIVVDFGSRDLYQLHYAAFFADCEHELRPVQSGYRLALVYNLIAQGSTRVPQPADNTEAADQIVQATKAWSQDETGPQKLVIPLAHQYSNKSLTFDSLRGTDMATIDAPGAPPLHCYLGTLEKYEDGWQEGNRVTRTYEKLRDLVPVDREERTYDSLTFNRSELIPKDALDKRAWDKVKEGEDTGNEGVKEERWYHQAAVILWLHEKHWEVISGENADMAVMEACSISDALRSLPRTLEAVCLRPGTLSPGWASTVADLVLKHGHVSLKDEMARALKALCTRSESLSDAHARKLAELLIQHGTQELAETFVENYRGPHAPGEPVLAPLVAHFGWPPLRGALRVAVVFSFRPSNLARGFWLLLDVAPPPANRGGPAQEEPGLETDRGAGTGSLDAAASARERVDLCAIVSSSLISLVASRRLAVSDWDDDDGDDYLQFGLRDMTATGAYLEVLERCGPTCWERLTRKIVEKLVAVSMTSATELLYRIAVEKAVGCPAGRANGDLSPGAVSFCESLADEVVAALVKEEDAPPPPPPSSTYVYERPDPARKAEWVCQLLQAFHCLKVPLETVDRVFAHFFDTPRLHDMDTTVVPALDKIFKWLGADHAKETPWFVKLCQGCLAELEKVCAVKPPEPRNWAVPATCGCDSEKCQELLKLCLNPARTRIAMHGVKEGEEAHLRDSVQRYGIPVWTEGRNGGPYLEWIQSGSRGTPDEAEVRRAVRLHEVYAKNVEKIEHTKEMVGKVLGGNLIANPGRNCRYQ